MPAFAPVFDRAAARDILVWLDALDPETGDGPSIAEKKKASSTANRDKDEKQKRAATKVRAGEQETEAPVEEPSQGAADNAETEEDVKPAAEVPASPPDPSP
jgi:hypothetical protein